MVLNRQRKVRVALAPLKTFLRAAQAAARIPRTDVTVCLISDAEIARMNQAYRRKKGPTDVLSFPARGNQQGSRGGGGGFGGNARGPGAGGAEAPHKKG